MYRTGRIEDSIEFFRLGGSEMTPNSRITACGRVVSIGDVERVIMTECDTEEQEGGIDYQTITARLGFSGFSVVSYV